MDNSSNGISSDINRSGSFKFRASKAYSCVLTQVRSTGHSTVGLPIKVWFRWKESDLLDRLKRGNSLPANVRSQSWTPVKDHSAPWTFEMNPSWFNSCSSPFYPSHNEDVGRASPSPWLLGVGAWFGPDFNPDAPLVHQADVLTFVYHWIVSLIYLSSPLRRCDLSLSFLPPFLYTSPSFHVVWSLRDILTSILRFDYLPSPSLPGYQIFYV